MKKAKRKQTKKPQARKIEINSNVRSLIILGIVAIGILVAVGVGHISNKNKDDFKLVDGQSHHSPGLAMTATYPNGWAIQDKSTINDPISILYATDAKSINDEKGNSSVITIAREPVDGNLDKVGQELLSLDSGDKALGTKLIKTADITVGGMDAKERETTSSLGHQELIVAVDSNNIGYIITLQTPENKWQALQPVLQTVVHSIQFDR